MFSAVTPILYRGACMLFSIVPGPSVVIANAMARGSRAGMFTIPGTQLSTLSMPYSAALE